MNKSASSILELRLQGLNPGKMTTEPEKCSICFSKIKPSQKEELKVIALACGHVYHAECVIETWFSRGYKTCPYCQQPYAQRIAVPGRLTWLWDMIMGNPFLLMQVTSIITGICIRMLSLCSPYSLMISELLNQNDLRDWLYECNITLARLSYLGLETAGLSNWPLSYMSHHSMVVLEMLSLIIIAYRNVIYWLHNTAFLLLLLPCYAVVTLVICLTICLGLSL